MGVRTCSACDLVMKPDADAGDRAIIEVIRYLAEGEKPWRTVT